MLVQLVEYLNKYTIKVKEVSNEKKSLLYKSERA